MVGEIVAGIVLGPSVLGLVWPQALSALFPPSTQPSLHLLGKIGLMLLMFQVGLEFDFGHLRTRSRSVVSISLAGILLPMLCALASDPGSTATLRIPTPSPVSSFSSAPVCRSRPCRSWRASCWKRRSKRPALCISAAAINDGVGWLLLAAASAMVAARFDSLLLISQVAALLAFAWIVMHWAGLWLGRVWRRGADGRRISR